MRIKILGAHNCTAGDIKLASLLIDDVLAIDAGALTSSLSFPAQQKLKAILLTHQHYDHVRDIPALAMNAFLHETRLNVYSIPAVYDALAAHLLNDVLYPEFLKKPEGEPAINFTLVPPNQSQPINGYGILAVPVNHCAPAVGYQVTSPDGNRLFYTGDTGPGLAECWQQVEPGLLITELTVPNRYEEFARDKGHLTPDLLKQELDSFREIKGYLPQVITVHMNPGQENEIATEIAEVARSLNNPIRLGYEGMIIDL